jgi:hypothetical protein
MGCFEHRGEIVRGGHVVDRVVDEHGIEVTPEADRAHVPGDVLTFGIERTAHREHVCGEIDQRHGEVLL